jgi:ABC-type multidrug transport system ATPase subunit
MKQKLAIGCAIIHRPQVLLLDEPTIGLDAAAESEVPLTEVVRNLRSQGAGIGNLGVSRPTL